MHVMIIVLTCHKYKYVHGYSPHECISHEYYTSGSAKIQTLIHMTQLRFKVIFKDLHAGW